MSNPDVSIEFDNGKINYRPGELLAGRVLVRVDSPLTVKGIHVSFKGYANVRWVLAIGANTYVFEGDDGIVHFRMTVYGPTPRYKIDRQTLTLAKGDHSFAFSFKIPLTRPTNGAPLPSSFKNAEVPFGSIRYFIECHVERPTLHSATRVQRDVHITRTSIDLSPGSSTPQESQFIKNVICFLRCYICTSSRPEEGNCCLCCCHWINGGPIDVVIRTDKGGYLPGESMRVSARIVNGSRRIVQKAYLHLAQTVNYVSRFGARKEDARTVTTIDHAINLKSEGTRDFDERIVLVPLGLEPTSTPESCKVLYITYGVILDVTTNGCTLPFKVELPITIGFVSE